MKRNKGITLIALVITIIVLLILAGVAISMLSGENGILKKAGEAKTKTEEAQKEESTALLDMEIDGYFIEKGAKYKCRYGYITGFALNGTVVVDTVQELEGALPEGYKVTLKYNKDDKKDEEITNKGEFIKTGMGITKNGEVVARTVVFGDTNCSGDIDVLDCTNLTDLLLDIECQNYQILAMDVNHDGIINNKNEEVTSQIDELRSQIDGTEDASEKEKLNLKLKNLEKDLYDSDIIRYYGSHLEYGKEKIENQKIYVSNPKTIKYTTKNQEKDNYIKSIPETFYNKGYKIEIYRENTKTYIIKGITRGTTTVGDIKEVLPENTIIKCGDTVLTNLDDTIKEDQTGATYKVYINSKKFGEILLAKFE